jgi:hypothetical protein
MNLFRTLIATPLRSLTEGLKVRDLLKFVPLAVLAWYFLRNDPNLPIFLTALGLVTLFAVASHILRKIIFWGHSTDAMYRTAMQSPIAAAICYASIVYFLATVFQSMMLYLK